MRWRYCTTQDSGLRFAFCYPYTLTDCNLHIDNILRSSKSESMVVVDELAKSVSGRSVPLIIFKSTSSVEVPVVVVTGRVHPGETPASFAVKGILDFLAQATPDSRRLRSRFEFRIVPMLNPDGVVLGCTRSDSLGQNLNRCYLEPSPQQAPSVHQLCTMMSHIAAEQRLFAVLDIHAHASSTKCFLLTNCPARDQEATLLAQQYAKSAALHSQSMVALEACMMDEEAMQRADRGDKVRGTNSGSSARVASYERFGCKLAVTLECSYVGRYVAHGISSWMAPDEWQSIGVACAKAMYDVLEARAFRGHFGAS